MPREKRSHSKGFSLIELLIGGVITGILVVGAIQFLESLRTSQQEASLKAQAGGDIALFNANRRKTLTKFDPSNAIIATPLSLTIPKTIVNSVTLVPNIVNEVITVNCGAVPANMVASLPAGYDCGGVCGAGRVPVSFTVNGGEAYPPRAPMVFPDGTNDKLAASLCINYNPGAGTLSLRTTYIIRTDPRWRGTLDPRKDRLEYVTETAVLAVPRPLPPGQTRPQILGEF
jgi:type II secretory pathway pseudopilin PulG